MNIARVARHFGISRSTVSRAINGSGYVKPELRETILRFAKEHNWVPSSSAASLKSGKTKTVAVLLNNFANLTNALILRSALAKLREGGYHVFISDVSRRPESLESELESYIQRRPDAVLAFPLTADVGEVTRRLIDNGVRVIAMGVCFLPGISAVVFDGYAQGFMAVERLVRQGRRRVLALDGFGDQRHLEENLTTLKDQPAGERLRGQRAAAEVYADQIEAFFYVSDSYRDFSFFRQALASRKFSAVVCGDESFAAECYRACAELNLRIPEDIAVIAIGNPPDYRDGFIPALELVDRQAAALGDAVGDLVLRNSKEIERIVISPALKMGDSVVIREASL